MKRDESMDRYPNRPFQSQWWRNEITAVQGFNTLVHTYVKMTLDNIKNMRNLEEIKDWIHESEAYWTFPFIYDELVSEGYEFKKEAVKYPMFNFDNDAQRKAFDLMNELYHRIVEHFRANYQREE